MFFKIHHYEENIDNGLFMSSHFPKTIERLSMTFIFPANGKNLISAVCCLAFVHGKLMRSFVFVVNVRFFPYFCEGLILKFDKKVTK